MNECELIMYITRLSRMATGMKVGGNNVRLQSLNTKMPGVEVAARVQAVQIFET
jgi:hypothetical protein